MGPFMVEIVYCRVTRRGRKKRKGMNKLARENCRNDGPAFQFLPPEDTVKITLDLSENGPVFSALDDMMMKLLDDENSERKKNKGAGGDAKQSLKRLLKSGIPGVEKMFAAPPDPNNPNAKKGTTKGFHKMTDGSKQKFMKAIFGEDGTSIDSGTAAALLAATCSGGDPEIADNIAQILLPELSETIDPTMMAALMAASSLILAGSNTEEVMKAMKAELANSGMSEEEILVKTQKMMKVFRREESSCMAEYSLASKQTNVALRRNETSPKDFSLVVMAQKCIASCGTTPENVAKVIMIQNQLSKRGAQSRHIAEAMKHQADFESKRAEVSQKITNALTDEKLKRDDVFNNVRLAQALENENEPSWKEVRSMKDILQGCSPNSPEAIELNLTRAVKSAGLKGGDIASALIAQKAMAALNLDARVMSQIINMEKVIADNGVPAVEIARVLSDGGLPKELSDQLSEQAIAAMPKDLTEGDVDCFLKFYDNLRLKANIPTEVIEHIDKNLIQVRCSLEDVADNMVASQLARGEKEHLVVRGLCETLLKTGSSTEIVATTMMSALRKVLTKSECEIMKDTGRTLFEQGIRGDDLTKTMTELILNLLDENIEWREEASKAMETVLKEAGGFPDQIRQLLQDVLPPEPPRPMSPRLAAELERLREQEDAREAEKARKAAQGESDSESFDEDEPDSKQQQRVKKMKKPKNPAMELIMSDSRRGSLVPNGSRRGSGQRSRCGSISLGGVERRGSYYSEDVSKRSTVAVVVDDPEGKKQMTDALQSVFSGEEDNNQQHGGGRSVNGPRASNVNGPVSGHGQVQGQEEGEVSAAHALSQAMAASLGMDVTSFLQMAASGSVPTPAISQSVLEAVMAAQKNLPAGAAQNPQAIMQAIMKAQGGNAENIPPEVLESILNAQKKLPPGAALNPQAVLQAVAASQQTNAAAQNPVMQAAIKAQADAAKSVTPDILDAVLKAQQSLPPGSANDPQALLQAIAKASGGTANIPPAVLAAVLNAQKNLPPGSSQNPKALLQSVQKLQENLSSGQLSPAALQSVLQSMPPAAQKAALAGMAQQNSNGSVGKQLDLSSLPHAALAAIIQSQGGAPGKDLSSLSPAALADIIHAQGNKAGGAGLDLSSLPPATLAALVQSQGGAFNCAGIDLSSLPPASLAVLAQSTGGGSIPAHIMSTIPRELLDAVDRMTPEEFGRSVGPGGDLADTLKANADKLQALFDSLAESGEIGGLNGGSFHLSLRDGKLSEDDVNRLLSVFKTSGIVSSIGGIARFRTMADMKGTIQDSQDAFDNALTNAKNRQAAIGVSDENRKLMDDILRQKVAEQQDLTSRVSMLLAGSSLTTTSGVKIQRREPVQELPYDMLVTDNGSTGDRYRRRTVVDSTDGASAAAHAAADRLSALTAQAKAAGFDPLQRSIKRTSLCRLRRLSEASEAKRKEEEEKRRIIGLRRAKVPLMVYSCGGFTRCFRIARYHVTDGPPIGVTYEGDASATTTTTDVNHA